MNESHEPKLKISPKMIVIGAVLLIGYLLIKPTLEDQFGWDLPGFVNEPQVAQDEAPRGDSGSDSDLNDTLESIQETVRTTDEPPSLRPADTVAMNEESATVTPPAETSKNPSTPSAQATSKAADEKPTPKVATKPPLSSQPKSDSKSAGKEKSTPNVATNPPLKTSPKPPAQPALGQLKELRGKVYESTAGLRYTPGSVDKHRLMHVMQHAEDNLDKPVHGVFSVEKKEILVLLDQAWETAQKRGPPQVRKEQDRGRTTYTVDMGKTIGYVGGQSGKRRNNPKCRKIKLVLEGTDVITAYPTQ